VLGDRQRGLTGPQIGPLLKEIGLGRHGADRKQSMALVSKRRIRLKITEYSH